MKQIQGKHVFESLEEVVDPKHTALLIIDMQNGLASPEGYTARQGDISISHQRSIIPALLNVLEVSPPEHLHLHIGIIDSKLEAFAHKPFGQLDQRTLPKVIRSRLEAQPD